MSGETSPPPRDGARRPRQSLGSFATGGTVVTYRPRRPASGRPGNEPRGGRRIRRALRLHHLTQPGLVGP